MTAGQDRIVEHLRAFLAGREDTLAAVRAESEDLGRHPDWPWIGFVVSGATRGGSWRWEKRVKPIYDTELSWAALSGVDPAERRKRLEKVGRFWQKTANFLEKAYDRLQAEGGPGKVREALAGKSPTETIAYWMTYPEVGPKYARNIMMDVHHPGFRDGYFAVDSRIEKLLPPLGYTGPKKYEPREAFLVALARDCGATCWDLDRTLYGAVDELVEALPGLRKAA